MSPRPVVGPCTRWRGGCGRQRWRPVPRGRPTRSCWPLIGAVVCFVVSVCRTSAPWSHSIGFFLRLGVVVIVIRVAIEILFGQRVPGNVLFTLPRVPLPSWAAAVSIGGPVTVESILNSFVLGLQFAVILLCFGAANSLASPYRLLRSLPAVLYETGVVVTVALAFTPELVQSIGDVRQARRQRGIPTKGVRGMRGVAVPVLESALDRSLAVGHQHGRTWLRAADCGGQRFSSSGQCDDRGRASAPRRRALWRHRSGVAIRTRPSGPGRRRRPLRGGPRRGRSPSSRSRYRPDPGFGPSGWWWVRASSH